MTQRLGTSVLHKIPADMREVILSHTDIYELWESLTPIARNEWICWVTNVKKVETREEHLERLVQDMRRGKRRPCCWPGCPHRRPKAQKWFEPKK